MAAPLQFLRDFKRLAIAAAQTDDHRSIGAPEQREQDRKVGGLLLEQLMNDQIVVSHHRIHESHGRTDLDHVLAAPFQSQRIFDLPLDRHDFQQRMIQQAFELAIDQRVQIPKLINLHQIGVVIGQHEFGIQLQEQVGHIVQMDQSIQLRGTKAILFAQLVSKQPGRLIQIMNQLRLVRNDVCRVVIDDQPIAFVQARFKGEIAYPCGAFARLALTPRIVVISLQRHVDIEQFARKPLQQHARNEPVQVAFVGQNYARPGQHLHGARVRVTGRFCQN